MNEHLTTSQRGLEFITKHEGIVLHVYRDVAGLDTIGVGHLIKPGEHFTTITRDEAFALLAIDVKKCETAIRSNVRVPLSQNQFDALVSFLFNVGTGPIVKSGVATELNAGHYDKVPAKLLEWCKARVNGQVVVVKGLESRRKAEAALFATPDEEAPPKHDYDKLDEETRAMAQAALAMSLDRSINELFTDCSTEDEANT